MPELSGSVRSPHLSQFLAASVDEAPAGIFAFDTNFRYMLWNRRIEEVFGKRRDEVLGRNAFDVFPFLRAIGEDSYFESALQGNSSHARSRYYSIPGGKSGHFDTRYRPIRNEQGEIIGGMAHIVDCAERVHAEEELRHEADVLDTIIRTTETVTGELDLQRVVQAATDAATQVSGAQFGAFFYNVINERGESYMLYTISGAPREAFSKFPMPRNTAVFAPTFAGEDIVRSGNITQDPRYGKNAPRRGMPEGHLPVCSYLAVPVKSRSGNEVFGGLFFGHAEPDKFTEASERLVSAIAHQAAIAIENARLYDSERRARERAEGSESKLAAIWASMTDAFSAFDRDWRYVYVNEKAREFTGKTRDEILGRSLFDIFPEVAGSRLENELRLAAEQRVARHFDFHFRPQNAWFECHAYPSYEGVSLYARDITAEKKAKEEVDRVQERLRFVATSTGVGPWYCDLPFDMLQWSEKTKEHFWLPADAHVTIDTFYRRLHPEDRERTRQAIAKSIAEHDLYDIDYRTVSDTGDIRWIRAIGRAFYDAQGQPIRFDGITVDETDRRKAEEALRRSERLATAGRLAATVAHEVNNPLEAITNLIYLCQHDPEATAGIREKLHMVDDELRRVAHIVRQTLGFYRETSSPQRINLSALVSGLIDLYRKRYVEKQVRLHTHFDDKVELMAVPGGIRQVVANLLSNALDASKRGDEVTVTVRCQQGQAEIKVSDTGHGISPSDRAKLFEPFFTTKVDVGTGLGLWVSKEIVEKHGGRITVETSTDSQNHGTVFTVELPTRECDILGNLA